MQIHSVGIDLGKATVHLVALSAAGIVFGIQAETKTASNHL